MKRFNQLVSQCVSQHVSDLHITGGHPVVLRKDGNVSPQRKVMFKPTEVDALAKGLMTRQQADMLWRNWSVDFAISVAGARLRVNIFATTRGLSLAIRFLPGETPDIARLNLHPSLKDFCGLHAGLVLFCGATGSGKTTTIAAMLNEINRTRAAHIVTLEEPVEYRFKSGKSFVEQRECGSSFQTFEQGLVDVLREAPDVIFVGELRHAETMRLTLNAAESGHLVFATLHSSNVEESLYRICNSFPLQAQEFVRYQLSSCLAGIVVQRLVYREDLGFRIPLLSVLRGTKAAKSTIRDNKLSQIESILEMGKDKGMFSFERYQKEFLDLKRDFIPPSVSLKPSEEISREGQYMSPLVDPMAAIRQHQTRPLAPDNASETVAYNLADDDTLDNVIQQIINR